jgi:hypothetical protein
MEHNKAPGTELFWKVIKEDLMPFFDYFYEECLPPFSLNFGVITLQPKTKDAK